MNKKDKDKIITIPEGQRPANLYDDGNIPKEDLPMDIIPDFCGMRADGCKADAECSKKHEDCY